MKPDKEKEKGNGKHAVLPGTGKLVAITSLILALLAFLPSIAPFTPAIIVSFFSLLGAIAGALSGWKRTAILTLYIIAATLLVSPMSSWIEQYIELGLLIILLVIAGSFLAVMLFIHYRKSSRKTHQP